SRSVLPRGPRGARASGRRGAALPRAVAGLARPRKDRARIMKPRMLIVDDEPDMLDFMERVFRVEYDVVRASSGEEALRELGRGRFAVVITDQKMPQMTGVELLERVGQRLPYLVKV